MPQAIKTKLSPHIYTLSRFKTTTFTLQLIVELDRNVFLTLVSLFLPEWEMWVLSPPLLVERFICRNLCFCKSLCHRFSVVALRETSFKCDDEGVQKCFMVTTPWCVVTGPFQLRSFSNKLQIFAGKQDIQGQHPPQTPQIQPIWDWCGYFVVILKQLLVLILFQLRGEGTPPLNWNNQ